MGPQSGVKILMGIYGFQGVQGSSPGGESMSHAVKGYITKEFLFPSQIKTSEFFLIFYIEYFDKDENDHIF